MSNPPVHWSLGYFKANGYSISVFCDQMHGAEIDLDKAIELLGPDLKIPEGRQTILDTWRCRICRRSGHSLTLGAPNGYAS